MGDKWKKLGGSTWAGPLLVAVAALLWGTDSVVRFPMAKPMDATLIVFMEHFIGVVALLPLVLIPGQRHQLFALGRREWGAAVFVGAMSSAVATTLFTLSFRYVNPSVAVLLQKIQPVLVVLIAYVILHERPKPKFYFWALVSLGAGIVLSFPDLKFDFTAPADASRGRGVMYATIAAVIWAASTVVSKVMLKTTSATVGTFWRYVFGLLMLALMLGAAPEKVVWHDVWDFKVALALVYISIISGVVPMIAYYAGMKRTQASVVTFVELLFPLSAVLLNTWLLNVPLSLTQLGAGVVLLFAVTMISI